MAKITSACLAAKSRPRPDAPAWMITGRRWGEGVTCSGPRERKNLPTWSIRWILVGSAKMPAAWSITKASSSQLCHQLIAYLQKFVGALVALVMLLRFVIALDGLVTIGKGDDVPTHPPTRQVVERGEEAGDIVGVLLADGKRGGQPNPGRRCSHPGEQRHRIMHRSLGSIPQGHVWCALVGIEDVVKIGEEDHVELAALARLGDVLVEFGTLPVIAAVSARMAPHGNAMVGRAMHEVLCQVYVLGHKTDRVKF